MRTEELYGPLSCWNPQGPWLLLQQNILISSEIYAYQIKTLSNIVLSLCFLLRYDERIDRVETRITARLRDQLGTAKNANEMFRIFSRFNALFVRPHIRGAIREYQTQLIQRVKDDIEALHDKFKV